MNPEKIVCDYETAKELSELKVEVNTCPECGGSDCSECPKHTKTYKVEIATVFSWIELEGIRTDYEYPIYEEVWLSEDIGINCLSVHFSAPTAEEVPLPSNLDFAHWHVNGQVGRHLTVDNIDVSIDGGTCRFAIFRCPNNEATARTQMLIWLIHNVPEAVEYYIKQGILVTDDHKKEM